MLPRSTARRTASTPSFCSSSFFSPGAWCARDTSQALLPHQSGTSPPYSTIAGRFAKCPPLSGEEADCDFCDSLSAHAIELILPPTGGLAVATRTRPAAMPRSLDRDSRPRCKRGSSPGAQRLPSRTSASARVGDASVGVASCGGARSSARAEQPDWRLQMGCRSRRSSRSSCPRPSLPQLISRCRSG